MTGFPPKRLVEWTDSYSRGTNLISFLRPVQSGNNISRIRAAQKLNGSNVAVNID